MYQPFLSCFVLFVSCVRNPSYSETIKIFPTFSCTSLPNNVRELYFFQSVAPAPFSKEPIPSPLRCNSISIMDHTPYMHGYVFSLSLLFRGSICLSSYQKHINYPNFIAVVLNKRQFCLPGHIWQLSGDIFIYHNWVVGGLLASSG